MSVSPGFRDFVLEQLEHTTTSVRAQRMFGAVGIYAGEWFFAIIDNDTLYFKADDDTRPAYESRGMGPFRPYGEGGEAMQYYQVPIDVLEDADALGAWAADAVAVAKRARRKPGRRKKR